MRCVQVVAGVLGRAGEEGKLKRLAAADAGNFNFTPAKGLHMPGEGAESAEYPRALKLGETIQDLEEVDRPLEEIMAEREEQRELDKAQRLAKATGPKI
jgi:small subunit ribosomal protein S2